MTDTPALIRHGQRAIDLGIVVRDAEAALGFYRDVLGLVDEGSMPMPVGAGGTMHRLRCGDSLIKLVAFDENPDAKAPRGGIPGASGYRYFTIHVVNIDEIAEACRSAGVRVVVEPVEIRPGVRIALINDPDGNTVEFVESA
ncbi:MAG: VOC family protein [Ilumatobacteraceae bacterium]|jgi:catechol 2,3-dioxygenase-like lactoylglutathione lyase family enzyme|nr:VOC family protein [Ilumatobacteraceae bacterium]MBL6759166.1 VOC family protein [Ilumatobacteraceae bacterium]